MNGIDEDVVSYSKRLSDKQLAYVLKKEWDAFRHRDYASVRTAAEARGWTVKNGERIE